MPAAQHHSVALIYPLWVAGFTVLVICVAYLLFQER
jgi:multidrug transporter EmrE-like cation transporter